jgi:hypothetical protein
MFQSLIRRARGQSQVDDKAAFESTTFSLTTAVPRPAERRADERLIPLLKVAKLICEAGERLMRVRNIAAGGVMGEVVDCPGVGEALDVELSSQRIPSKVVWVRDGLVGIKFDQSVDLGELLAGRKPRHGFRPRPPRLSVGCSASVRLGDIYYKVEVHDISLGGMKVEPIDQYCVGKKVTIVIESLKPIKGEVRWYSERRAGIVFDKPLDFEELAEWVGKRLELASLKASYKD